MSQTKQEDFLQSSMKTYHEVLDVIYTHENGQIQAEIPLSQIGDTFDYGKEMFFEILKQMFETYCCFREVNTEPKPIPKLHKISCCVYSETWVRPDWYKECGGKYYYDD